MPKAYAVVLCFVTVIAWVLTAINPLPADSHFHHVFLHFAVEFTILLVAALIIEGAIKKHEEAKWKGADALVAGQLATLANTVTRSFRAAFGASMPDISMDDVKADILLIDKMNEHSADVLIPQTRSSIEGLTIAGWQALAADLSSAKEASAGVLNAFAIRLHPEAFATVVTLQNQIDECSIIAETGSDVLGVPVADFGEDRVGVSRLHKKEAYEQISAEAAVRLMQTANNLRQIAQAQIAEEKQLAKRT